MILWNERKIDPMPKHKGTKRKAILEESDSSDSNEFDSSGDNKDNGYNIGEMSQKKKKMSHISGH